ncbi:hypothetical protein ESP50_06400 [Agromyces atrinae]|uniref:Uncharacterized protein n=1 Tax=Agromyces atrinae TaxID=592376 RepID=A0A4Q2MBT5_9MICO|nr:hypothetical protein ESP50_06400 [Agromyces atrinae]
MRSSGEWGSASARVPSSPAPRSSRRRPSARTACRSSSSPPSSSGSTRSSSPPVSTTAAGPDGRGKTSTTSDPRTDDACRCIVRRDGRPGRGAGQSRSR